MEFIQRLYIADLSALQCKKEHKNIINQKWFITIKTINKQLFSDGTGKLIG